MCIVFFVVGFVLNALFGVAQTGTTATSDVSARSVAIVSSVAPALEGCVAGPSQECSYVASRPGRYLATGSGWTVSIVRASGRTVVFRDGASPNYIDAIERGDQVTASGGTGVVRVGARPPRLGR